MKPSMVVDNMVRSMQGLVREGELNGTGIAHYVYQVVGDMGTGKTEVARAIAKALGWNYIPLYTAQMDPSDLLGMPRVNAEGKTYWTQAEWMPPVDKPTVIVLEELNRAPQEVQQALMQGLTDFRIHNHEFPKQCLIVICNNPCDSIYHVAELDPALNSRGCLLKFDVSVEDWLQWAYANAVDPMVVQFIAANNDMLNSPVANEPCPNPRAWTNLAKIVDKVNPNSLMEVASGLVGKTAALTFIKFRDTAYEKPVTAKEILADYAKVKDKVEKQENHTNWATVKDIIAYLPSVKLSKPQLENLKNFIVDMKAEWEVQILRNVGRELKSKLVQYPELLSVVTSILEQTTDVKKK